MHTCMELEYLLGCRVVMRLFEWRYGTLEEAAWRGFHSDDCEANIYGFNVAVPTGGV
jgi:hypothetical protein